jgi:Zn-dependent protease with chaperone function
LISISLYERVMVSSSYFDGRTTRVHTVSLSIVDTNLLITGEGIDLRVPFSTVKVDERLGRAARKLRLPDGSFCEVRDLAALDALLATTSHRDGSVDRMQRHLKFVLFSCVAFVALLVFGYKVVLPWAAARTARQIPAVVGRSLTIHTLTALDGGKILLPSKLDTQRRRKLTAQFAALELPEGGHPSAPLLFRNSPRLGANAFALPDGTIVVLDDLVRMVDDDQQIMAVLSHELGHVHGHHQLQLLIRSTAVGAFWSIYIGDISHLLAAAPAAVIEARYSQSLESEADDYGAALLVKNHLSPELLAVVLRKLQQRYPGAADGSYLTTHPATQERIDHLHALATATAR